MVSKVSDITIQDVANYLKLDDYNENELETYLNIAKNYISNYTGIPEADEDEDDIEEYDAEDEEVETLDSYADFIIVVYILCQDMHDNRCMYVDKANMNKVVQTILDMHSRNLL
jgi:hypothetical protein